MTIHVVSYCPNCTAVMETFHIEGTFEGFEACPVCHIAYIDLKNLGKYTKKVKKKLKNDRL